MNREERRLITNKKWESRLKKFWKSGVFWRNLYLVKKEKPKSINDYPKAEDWTDYKKDRFGVMLKHTRTLYNDSKWLDIKELHKRNLKNRTVKPEELEEANEYIEEMNNPFSFEKYCNSCDNFPGDMSTLKGYNENSICPFKKQFIEGKLNGMSEWKKLGCDKFWD